jgi:hypothetical protein
MVVSMVWEVASVEDPGFWLVTLKERMSARLQSRMTASQRTLWLDASDEFYDAMRYHRAACNAS